MTLQTQEISIVCNTAQKSCLCSSCVFVIKPTHTHTRHPCVFCKAPKLWLQWKTWRQKCNNIPNKTAVLSPHGHEAVLAEATCFPSRFRVTVYKMVRSTVTPRVRIPAASNQLDCQQDPRPVVTQILQMFTGTDTLKPALRGYRVKFKHIAFKFPRK